MLINTGIQCFSYCIKINSQQEVKIVLKYKFLVFRNIGCFLLFYGDINDAEGAAAGDVVERLVLQDEIFVNRIFCKCKLINL
jgi:hypothetical protein